MADFCTMCGSALECPNELCSAHQASSPWLPIAECGELEGGLYLCAVEWLDENGVPYDWDAETVARTARGYWDVERGCRITHVHRMGPIRGPGEG